MYEDTYGTDWETLDRGEAMNRAFALGVAASLGRPVPEEYDRVRAEMDTAYNERIVELAYEEGRTKAERRHDGDAAVVWAELVVDETVTVEEDDLATGGRAALPTALDRPGRLDRPHRNDLDRVQRPDVLDR